MTVNPQPGNRILGSLRTDDGTGIVRMEDRFRTGIDDLWSAITTPERLSRWYGDVDGDLRLGGRFHLRIPNALEASGHVDTCEPPHRLVVKLRDTDPQPGQPEETVIEATLTADGDHTLLVVEDRGLPSHLLHAYGAGVQIHFENLDAYLEGRDRSDIEARWQELLPAYEALAAEVT
jgi:uncharacterized protein YndB with AHSA1/START domain